MPRALAILIIALTLAACDAVNTVTEGFKQARAVETDLETSTGLRPQVGFNWNNGKLTSVTVMFPRVHDGKPLPELAEAVRSAVAKEFKQMPDNIILSFSLGKGNAATKA